MVNRELSAETINRLRTWLFLGVVVSGAMIVGLSNAVWSSSCDGSIILGYLNSFIGSLCGASTGTNSHVLFDFGDGVATLVLGVSLLATCALAFGFQKNLNALMMLATALSLLALVIVASAAITFMADEGRHATQSLLLLLAVTVAAPILSGAFVWLDQAYQDEELNGDTEAWA